jgi:hypothetical protein
MIERAAAGGGLEIKAHPHMLRDACGYALANKGHDTTVGDRRQGDRIGAARFRFGSTAAVLVIHSEGSFTPSSGHR